MFRKLVDLRSMRFLSGSFLLLSILMPSVKFYFLLSAVFVLVIFWVTKSWEKTVVYAYWPLAVYYVGQLYVFLIIEPKELNNPLYPDGRSLYFKFTPLLVLGISMIISWLFKLVTGKFRTNWLVVILLVIVGLNTVSGMLTQVLPWWVALGLMAGELSLVVWIWWTMFYLGKSSERERNRFWGFLGNLFKLLLIVGSLLVVAQGIKGSGLGLVVEQSGILPYSDAGSDAGGLLNRPIGIWTNANEAAFGLMTYFLAWLMIKVKFGKDSYWFGEKWLLVPLIALVWLQSRSVFLALVPILIWWVYYYFDEIRLGIKSVRLGGANLLLMLTGMLAGIMVLVNRFWNAVTNFGSDSGWGVRANLISVALRLIGHNFWWGVGVGNFIPIAFRDDLTGVMKSFPEAVHNGWILILSEQGWLGFMFWVLFLGLFGWWWWKKYVNNRRLRWLLAAGFMAQFLVMMFQPFSAVLMPEVVVGVLLLADENKLA